MKKVCLIVTIALLLALVFTQKQIAQAQNDNAERHRNVRNPKTTVIIDYVDSFEHHKDGHERGGPPDDEEPPPPDTHLDGHFDLIGGVWADSDESTSVIDPGLTFYVDLWGFPDGSENAILDAFNAWELETDGVLVGETIVGGVTVAFGDYINTYSMRNLGGRGVLAVTYITWDDADDNGEINDGEEFLEMDVIHNFTVKWGTDDFTPRGKWWDVQNVATHEIGHVFGLDHTGNAHNEDKYQTMYASAPPKETEKRSLEPDGDIPGIRSDFLGYGAP